MNIQYGTFYSINLVKKDSAGLNYILWNGNVLECTDDDFSHYSVKSVQEVLVAYNRIIVNGVG